MKMMITRKEYLIEFATQKINESNKIIENASEKCSNAKIFFLSFCLPATATFVSTFFTLLNNDLVNYNILLYLSIIASVFYFLISIVALWSHASFYAIQYRYRKVKDSIETMREKLLFLKESISDDITSETFRSYYESITNVSKNTMSFKKMMLKSIKDSLTFMIPLVVIFAFWIAMIIHFGGLI